VTGTSPESGPAMSADVITNYAWIFWLALILIFVIVEVLTVDLTFLMLALGSIGGLTGALFGLPWWAQILLAGVLCVLLLFALRPRLLRILKSGGDTTKSNVDALLGLRGTVTTDFAGITGHVKLANGEIWTARLAVPPGHPMEVGDRVVVTAIDGATAVVVPTERNIHE
jgi:membrane protein implicated in regulation of membrane protease activity